MNGMVDMPDIACQRGCASHPTTTIQVKLGGPTAYEDLTPIPWWLGMEFEMEVWDTRLTPVDGGPYCPARDTVSETIISTGVWEPQETAVLLLALEALADQALQPALLDIGAQVGWFSMVASRFGADVTAIEADPDAFAVLRRNLGRRAHHLRLTPNTPQLVSVDDTPRYVMKVDIEGAEADAIRWCGDLIDKGRIEYILMEMSPVFNDGYPQIAQDLFDRGYQMYRLPPKNSPPTVLESLADLIPFEVFHASKVKEWHQENVLFALGGIQ